MFSDGTSEVFDAVISAAGYADDSSWLRIPDAVDSAGNFVEDHGVSPVPGLLHVGRSWQSSRASARCSAVLATMPLASSIGPASSSAAEATNQSRS